MGLLERLKNMAGKKIDLKKNARNLMSSVSRIQVANILTEKNIREINPNDDSIKTLADSIKENGLLQALVVRTCENGYVLLLGHRRLAAVKLLGRKEVEVKIIEGPLSQTDIMVLQIAENFHREDLSIIAKARLFKQGMANTGLNQRKFSAKIGIDHSSISRHLKALKLNPEMQEYIDKNKGEISLRLVNALTSCEGEKLNDLWHAIKTGEIRDGQAALDLVLENGKDDGKDDGKDLMPSEVTGNPTEYDGFIEFNKTKVIKTFKEVAEAFEMDFETNLQAFSPTTQRCFNRLAKEWEKYKTHPIANEVKETLKNGRK